eukprot:6378618-Amphidinium_carterae.1
MKFWRMGQLLVYATMPGRGWHDVQVVDGYMSDFNATLAANPNYGRAGNGAFIGWGSQALDFYIAIPSSLTCHHNQIPKLTQIPLPRLI